MYKHLLLIGLTSLLVATLIASYGQTRPRQAPTKPATSPSPTPKPDLLVWQDETQLEVLVTEITDKEIVYKRFSNPNGPNFRVQKADFSFIKYGSNGEIEQFTKVVQPAPAPVQPTPAQSALTPAQPAQARSTSNAPPLPTNPSQLPHQRRHVLGF